ncbi:MAG TPA: MAPEG family protein [Rhizobiaceae bacterium]|nr:MAPEG family protein [Rhizobiaceae bacterium]
MAPTLTAHYAAALGVMMIVLGAQVIVMRARTGISILDGGNMALAESMRRHGNFIENVPMALILMGLAEVQGAPAMLLHGVGIALIAGRILHATGIDHQKPANPARIVGATLTTLSMLATIAFIAWRAVSG